MLGVATGPPAPIVNLVSLMKSFLLEVKPPVRQCEVVPLRLWKYLNPVSVQIPRVKEVLAINTRFFVS